MKKCRPSSSTHVTRGKSGSGDLTDKLRFAKQLIDEYCTDLTLKRRKKRTTDHYRYLLNRIAESLNEAGLETHPKKVGMAEINHIITFTFKGLSTSDLKHTITIYGKWLRVKGKNQILEEMDLLWPRSERKVTWLTPYQLMDVLNQATGILKPLLHLAGQLGLRLNELTELKWSDISSPYIYVLGKGHMEGKLAKVKFHKDTRQILSEWRVQWNALAEEHRKRHPGIPVPDNIFIHVSPGQKYFADSYVSTSLGNLIRRFSRQLEIDFSAHTFRRSYALFLKKAGVPVSDIKDLMRHENIATTILYLCLDDQDVDDARNKQYDFEDKIKATMCEGA